jgi:signal peptidase I
MPTWFAVTLAVAGVPLLAAVAARMAFVVVTVVGPSMAPTLDDGDRVLVARRWARGVRRGDVVAARMVWTPPGPPAPGPFGVVPSWVVKRAVALGGDRLPPLEPSPIGVRVPFGDTVPPGAVFLVGDNPGASGDSRAWGPVPAGEVVGVVVRHLPRRR